jgi:hypothetical protein
MSDMDPTTAEAYRELLSHAMNHTSETSRNIAALLLNSYNYNLPDTGFLIGKFRNLDAINRKAVLRYLAWLGSAGGLYPPSEDMDELKDRWVENGWGNLGRDIPDD